MFDDLRRGRRHRRAGRSRAVDPGHDPRTATAPPSPGPHTGAHPHRRSHGRRAIHRGTAPQATLRFLASPTDVNWGGKVHGGRTMHWMDDAAFVCGADWAGAQVLASYIGGIRFYRPIIIGHVVEVTTRLIHTGPRSMHLSVHVTSTDAHTNEPVLAAHALAVFVALDERGKARPILRWEPASEEDRRLDKHARHLIDLRELVEPFTPLRQRARRRSLQPLHTPRPADKHKLEECLTGSAVGHNCIRCRGLRSHNRGFPHSDESPRRFNPRPESKRSTRRNWSSRISMPCHI
jgi:acyl-CoA hydrolase